MLLEDAIMRAGAVVLRFADWALALRETAAQATVRADELGYTMAGDIMRQAAEQSLRSAAAREEDAQAIQQVLAAARKAAPEQEQ